MDRSFPYNRRPGTASRPKPREFPQWTHVTQLRRLVLRNSMGADRKKIFAIVAPPVPAELGCKAIRRILVFDSHPDSLRLVFGPRASRGQLSDPERIPSWVVALVWILVVGLMMAMFWPFS